jgi:hypothetical protein
VHARRRWSRSAPPAVLGHQPRGRIACLRQRRHRLPGSAAVCGGALHWGEPVQLLGRTAEDRSALTPAERVRIWEQATAATARATAAIRAGAEVDPRAGKPVYYGGGRLAADLTLPKLRARWEVATPAEAADTSTESPAADAATGQPRVRSAATVPGTRPARRPSSPRPPRSR